MTIDISYSNGPILPKSFLIIICRILLSGLIQSALSLGMTCSVSSEITLMLRVQQDRKQHDVNREERKRKEQLVSDDSLSCREFKIFCTHMLSKGMGR